MIVEIYREDFGFRWRAARWPVRRSPSTVELKTQTAAIALTSFCVLIGSALLSTSLTRQTVQHNDKESLETRLLKMPAEGDPGNVGTTPRDANSASGTVHESTPAVSSELEFLVTNYLSNYGSLESNEDSAAGAGLEGDERTQALSRIRNAASELASAFSALGAFGTGPQPCLGPENQMLLEAPASRPATFADAKRQWSSCPPSHLAHLVESAVANGATVDDAVQEKANVNLIQAAAEAKLEKTRNPESGRTLDEAIVLDSTSTQVSKPFSCFQQPIVIRKRKGNSILNRMLFVRKDERQSTDPPTLTLASDCMARERDAASAVRSFLDLRNKVRNDEEQLRSLVRSHEFQRDRLHKLTREREGVSSRRDIDEVARINALDEIKEGEASCGRVISQLDRQIETLEPHHIRDNRELAKAQDRARESFRGLTKPGDRGDPFCRNDQLAPGRLRNRIVRNITSRQLGLQKFEGRAMPRSMGSNRPFGMMVENRRALLMGRISHAVTISTHLAYPVYCLRFDRTGRYFVTGADDCLARVFCMAGEIRPRRGLDTEFFTRGAVLVCTLRGHAGVINDIAVSSDNSLVATASEDGDCRIWGLRSGQPVAILRGHVGGANMVSWSSVIPYRLVTTGADGFARTWDIREACLKRYGTVVGKRPEYIVDESRGHPEPTSTASQSSPTNTTTGDSFAREEPQNDRPHQEPQAAIPLPPLPGPSGETAQGESAQNQDAIVLGEFVANDTVDEGVKLISKFRHVSAEDEHPPGPGTRSRRSIVKVICISRCPNGAHFATGSDDGVCRVWLDEDMATLTSQTAHRTDLSDRGTKKPLLSLTGHAGAVTDLEYSHIGNRLLTASQKDGVVRIWSWNVDPASVSGANAESIKMSHVLIQLKTPRVLDDGAGARRKHAVSCDVATWVCDDSKIVTSQCELVKQSGTEINPGSQFLCLWDSFTGQCLLAVGGAHTRQCPALLTHPMDPMILCSAGADGVAKVWDCESGTAFFSFENKVEYGAVDEDEVGKTSGFLDGSFFPDGSGIVLTDESGRVCMFDTKKASVTSYVPPDWMKEQYFANDYYELLYDSSGYCVERGSEQPPHLAPVGVRCTNLRTPFPDIVSESFKKLCGPMPIDVRSARRRRLSAWARGTVARTLKFSLPATVVGQLDPDVTAVVLLGELGGRGAVLEGLSHPRRNGAGAASHNSEPRRLSSNWRWGDYSDILREDGYEEEPDADDEEFELNEGRSLQASMIEEESDSDLDPSLYDYDASTMSTRGRRSIDMGSDVSVDETDEFMSTNNTPTGPFVSDYETFFFKFTRPVRRGWLRRGESNSSYGGRKSYSPQLGDTVVYIPRAHLETIKRFPSMRSPWLEWPAGAAWPVVRCCIRHIRYRLPFKAFYKPNQGGLRSAVAILALEITGVPVLTPGRRVSWSQPSFVAPEQVHTFEVPLFESDDCEFILPIGLYTTRLTQLEAVVDELEVPIESYYAESTQHEDPELAPFPGRVEQFLEEKRSSSYPGLHGSGFGSIQVAWTAGGIDYVSPWDVSVVGNGTSPPPSRPSLTDDEKKTIRDALNLVKSSVAIDEAFSFGVDEERYSDYSNRVEVPMDLAFISCRLEADYYATRLGAVSDVKLIRDNCAKYNGDEDELTGLASKMLQDFEKEVLSGEEVNALHNFQTMVESTAASGHRSLVDSDGPAVVAAASSGARRSRPSTRSQLESLPVPSAPGRRRSQRTIARRRPPNFRSSANESLSSMSARSLHDRSQRYRTRRSTRSSVARTRFENHPIRRSSRRAGQRRPEYGESSEEDIAAAETSLATSNSTRVRSRGGARVSGRASTETRSGGRGRHSETAVPPARLGRSRTRTRRADESVLETGETMSFRTEEGSASRQSQDESFSLSNRDSPDPSGLSVRIGTRSEEHSSDTDEIINGRRAVQRPQRTNQRPEGDNSEARRRRSSGRGPSNVQDTSSSSESDDNRSESDESVHPDESEDSEIGEDLESEALSSRQQRNSRNSVSRRMGGRDSTRATRRRGSAPVVSYEVPSSSEFNSDGSGGSDEELPPAKRARTSRRTAPRISDESTPHSKREWPDIDRKKITQVTHSILDRLGDIDEDGLFAIPVVEAVPDLAESYLQLIKHPMDFRTIREDRLQRYRSIEELRKDLILVFENCIAFNPGTEYADVATTMLGMLEDIFREVCNDSDVLLPRRW